MARFRNYTPEPQANSGFDSLNLSQSLKSQIKTCQQVSLNTHQEGCRQIQQMRHTLFLRMCNVIKLRHPSPDGLVLPEGQRDAYKTPRRQATPSTFYASRLSSCLSTTSSIQEAFKPLFSFNFVFLPPSVNELTDGSSWRTLATTVCLYVQLKFLQGGGAGRINSVMLWMCNVECLLFTERQTD